MNHGDRPGTPLEEPRATLSLLDYRRRVADLYTQVRALAPERAHDHWRAGRDELFGTHAQSAIPPDGRTAFEGLPVYPYDPSLRFEAEVTSIEPTSIGLPHSGDGTTKAVAFGTVELDFPEGSERLTLFWLDQYGGGVFLPFRDDSNESDTYGGGRYLLDSAKGADLGSTRGGVVLDFNFAYHPSCVHDDRWSCPLSPPQNRMSIAIRGGEHL